jgi:hypothetical protein
MFYDRDSFSSSLVLSFPLLPLYTFPSPWSRASTRLLTPAPYLSAPSNASETTICTSYPILSFRRDVWLTELNFSFIYRVISDNSHRHKLPDRRWKALTRRNGTS